VQSSSFSFAGEWGRRPYKADHVQAWIAGRVGSKETVAARSPEATISQMADGTSSATGGVRVDQVGVNPSGERSPRRGVANATSATRPLACDYLASGGPQGRSLLVVQWLATATKRRGLNDSMACSWVSHL